DRAGFLAPVALHRAQCGDHFAAIWQLLDQHGRGAHHREGHRKILVVERLDVDQIDRSVIPNRLPQHQRTNVGISATARPEDGRAACEIVYIIEPDFHASPSARSPTALTLMRTAPPGRYCSGSSS